MQKILLIEYHRNLSTGFIIEPKKRESLNTEAFPFFVIYISQYIDLKFVQVFP